MVAVVHPGRRCEFAERFARDRPRLLAAHDVAGLVFHWFIEPHILQNAWRRLAATTSPTSRARRSERRPERRRALAGARDGDPDRRPRERRLELVQLEQQAQQDREERLLDQAQANKELIRNLAHEIKNPLGGIRGAAQLLEMEIESGT